MSLKFTIEQLNEKCKKRTQEYRQKILEKSIFNSDSNLYEIDSHAFYEIEKSCQLPTKTEMLKNLISAAKEAFANGMDIRSPEEVEKVLTICIHCPKYIESGPRCGVCGCFLKGKSQLKTWHCPLKKW